MKRDEYYLDIALSVAKRSTCLKKQYGAVIVKNNEIIATGYNGAPRGEKHCSEYGFCSKENCKSGDFSEYLSCRSVHAEMNAIISAARSEMIDSTLYLAGWCNGEEILNPEPCEICRRLIINAGISKVIARRNI